MAQLFPFRGYRYDPEKVGRLDTVVTQPYDKISPEMLQRYFQQNPYNISRVIKNSNYQEAGQYLERWIEEGVLKQDSSPSLYLYEQVFEFDAQRFSRQGFIGLVSLQDATLAVKGHEKILKAPLEDRLNLIRATESNEGLIFMLYSDPAKQVDRILDALQGKKKPTVEVEDEYGVLHRLSQLSDRQTQEQIIEALKRAPFYIADGHHRFETSVLYFRECRKKGFRTSALESFDKRMIALFNMEGSGLKILPTHRGIRNLSSFDLNRFLSKLKSYFEVKQVGLLSELEELMSEPGHRIGLLVEDKTYLVCLHKTVENDSSFMQGVSETARQLDVNILHDGILEPLLGIGPEEVAAQKHVDYYRGHQELVARLRKRECQVGFLLNPTTVEQVQQISEKGEKMPQKSTDFYPKLLTGLVLMKMQTDKIATRDTLQSGFLQSPK